MMYVNDVLLGTADISSVNTSGDVAVAYGIYADDAQSTGKNSKTSRCGVPHTTSARYGDLPLRRPVRQTAV